MNQEAFTDAISELEENLIVEHYETKLKMDQRQRRNKKVLRCAAVAAVLVLAVAGSLTLLTKKNCKDGYIPEYITLKPIQYTGEPFSEEDLSDFLPGAKEDAIDTVLNHFGDPEDVAGLRAEDLHFSNGFHYVYADETGNYLDNEFFEFLILHGRKVVGRLSVGREDGQWWSSPTGKAPQNDALTELLQQYDGSELAMVLFGDAVEAAITPDGVIHYLNGSINIPEQSDAYYPLFYTGNNCITGID